MSFVTNAIATVKRSIQSKSDEKLKEHKKRFAQDDIGYDHLQYRSILSKEDKHFWSSKRIHNYHGNEDGVSIKDIEKSLIVLLYFKCNNKSEDVQSKVSYYIELIAMRSSLAFMSHDCKQFHNANNKSKQWNEFNVLDFRKNHDCHNNQYKKMVPSWNCPSPNEFDNFSYKIHSRDELNLVEKEKMSKNDKYNIEERVRSLCKKLFKIDTTLGAQIIYILAIISPCHLRATTPVTNYPRYNVKETIFSKSFFDLRTDIVQQHQTTKVSQFKKRSNTEKNFRDYPYYLQSKRLPIISSYNFHCNNTSKMYKKDTTTTYNDDENAKDTPSSFLKKQLKDRLFGSIDEGFGSRYLSFQGKLPMCQLLMSKNH